MQKNTPINEPVRDPARETRGGDVTRRTILASAATLAASLAASWDLPAEAAKLSNKDIAILNFALQLEYLEAEFYLFATTGSGLEQENTSGRGKAGATTGGSQVNFNTPSVQAVATELARDEKAHVLLLRSVLGRKAVAKPAINLAALGVGFGNENEFLLVSRALEDIGVSAYGGAAAAIKSPKILTAAARILSVEALHSGNIRLQVVAQGLAGSDSPVDSLDQPAAANNYIPTDENGLSIIRTPAQVAGLAGPFFPNGLNSKVP